MNISTYIIDDEYHAVKVLAGYVHKTPGIDLCGSATDPVTALHEITAIASPDLVLLDIDMPGLNGLELARLLTGRASIVFTTSSRDFGPEAYQLAVLDYLLKPISYERFLQCLQKFRDTRPQKQETTPPHSFFVKTGTKGKLLRIFSDEILYVKSDRNYVDIHVLDRVITAYLTLGDLTAQLPPEKFFRVHRSHLINLDKILAIEPGHIRLTGEILVELGHTYREALMTRLAMQVITSSRERQP